MRLVFPFNCVAYVGGGRVGMDRTSFCVRDTLIDHPPTPHPYACGSNYNWNGEITTGRVKLQLGCLQLGSPGGAPSNKVVFGAFTFRSAGDVTHIAFRRGSQGKPGCGLTLLAPFGETRWNYKVDARVN